MWHDIMVGVSNNLVFDHILVVFVGTVFGLIIGALPGLSAVSGIALLLPFTFGMDPAQGLIMLAAVYMSAEYGGSISSILINTPGGAAAACTILDGTPMTRKGQAQEALYLSLLASAVGGLFGIIVLIFFTQPLAKASLWLGPSEIFWIGAAGLALVSSLSGSGNLLKGLVGTTVGLAMTLVGQDMVTGDMRYTFDDYRLVGGIPLVPAFLGLFSVASVLGLLELKDGAVAPLNLRKGVLADVIRRMTQMKVQLLWSSIVGTLVGIIPGTGASIASFVAYAEAKRISKHPEEFGKGSWEGVAAPEAANNAIVGGSLVPLLALGIPASASAALMFGALSVHGIIPGPRLFTERAELAYTFMIGLITTVIAMVAVGLATIRWSARLVRAPRAMMVPGIFILSVIGAYGIANSVFDVYVLVIVGLVAYVLSKLDVPLVTMALGLVLGRLMEESFQQAALLAGVEEESVFVYFLTRPVTLFLMLLATAILVNGLRSSARERKLASSPLADSTEPSAQEAAEIASELVAPVKAPAYNLEPTPAGQWQGPSLRTLNLGLVVVLWVVGWFIYAGSGEFTPAAAEFPLIVVAAFAILGAVIAFNNLRPTAAATTGKIYPFGTVPWRDLLLSIVALIALTVAVGPIGFYEASLLYAAIGCWLLLANSGLSFVGQARKAIAFAAVFMVVVWFMFHLFLQVPTPPGLVL